MNGVALYVVPIIAFLITMILMYLMDSSDDDVKNDPKHILIRIILPSLVMAVLTFVVLRYKDSDVLNSEPTMKGNYFDQGTGTTTVPS